MAVIKKSCPRCVSLTTTRHCKSLMCSWRVCYSCTAKANISLVFDVKKDTSFIREGQ